MRTSVKDGERDRHLHRGMRARDQRGNKQALSAGDTWASGTTKIGEVLGHVHTNIRALLFTKNNLIRTRVSDFAENKNNLRTI